MLQYVSVYVSVKITMRLIDGKGKHKLFYKLEYINYKHMSFISYGRTLNYLVSSHSLTQNDLIRFYGIKCSTVSRRFFS